MSYAALRCAVLFSATLVDRIPNAVNITFLFLLVSSPFFCFRSSQIVVIHVSRREGVGKKKEIEDATEERGRETGGNHIRLIERKKEKRILRDAVTIAAVEGRREKENAEKES